MFLFFCFLHFFSYSTYYFLPYVCDDATGRVEVKENEFIETASREKLFLFSIFFI